MGDGLRRSVLVWLALLVGGCFDFASRLPPPAAAMPDASRDGTAGDTVDDTIGDTVGDTVSDDAEPDAPRQTGQPTADLVRGLLADDGKLKVWFTPSDGTMFHDNQGWAEGWEYPRFFDVGDVDGDGKEDLVRGLRVDGLLTVWVNPSTGTGFASHQIWGEDWNYPELFAVGDATGDGKADLVRGLRRVDGKLDVWVTPSDGARFDNNRVWADAWAFPVFLAVGDVDGDGFADLVRGIQDAGDTVRVEVNQSTGSRFDDKAEIWADSWLHPEFLEVGDVDGDGLADLVRGYKQANGKLRLHINPSTGAHFAAGTDWAKDWVYPSFVAIGNLDGS